MTQSCSHRGGNTTMAKKIKQEEIDYSIYDQNIEECDAGEYIKEIVLKYGINVSVFRACSMIIDGLTPVQRRKLYTFYINGATPDKPRFKAPYLLGRVTGLHPHGDNSIEKSFINEIKEWESNVELYDVNGNKGSLTGDRAAATRYLEVRLSKYAMKCFFDEFDPSIADMVPSNTRRELEPVTISSKYPHFLFSLLTGIGWGNAISVPPYNVSEVCALTIALIKNPQMENVYLYPDSPRGYDIIESDDIVDICEAGNGTLRIQARMDYYDDENGRYIEVTGFPERTVMNGIMKKISTMILEKQINGIDTLADKTQYDDVKFWIMLTNDADPEFIINMLYKKTALRSTININLNFAARTHMQPVGIKAALLIWIANRINMKHRLYAKLLSKKKQRIHELEGVLVMLAPENVDKTIDIIRNSSDDNESIDNLMNGFSEYNITSYQAACIMDIGLRRINRANRVKFQEEQDRLHKEVSEVYNIVTSDKKLKETIIEDLEECIKLFGRPRRCRIVSPDVLKPPVHRFSIVITQKYIKKLSPNTTSIGSISPDDEVVAYFPDIPEDTQIFVVDTTGRIYGVKLPKVKSHELSSKGDDLTALVGLKGTPIRAFKTNAGDDVGDITLVMFMKSGIVKRTPLSQYVTNRMELQGAILNTDDKVSYAVLYNEKSPSGRYALIYTTKGLGIVVELSNITITDRLTKGSQYLKLEEGDEIQGVCSTDDTKTELLIVSTKGYAKFCDLDDIFKTNKRRANMIRLTGLNDEDSVFKMIPWDKSYKKIQCLLQSGTKVDLLPDDIMKTTRVSKGKKAIPVKRGDAILKIKTLEK